MPHSFNLIKQPFIPCLMPDGTRRELGLAEVLLRAHEIRAIRDGSPLATIALIRLLLAVLHRVFGPRDLDQWGSVWQAGAFDEGPLGSYFDQWRDRFDLCHTEHPFYQVADLEEGEGSVWRLAFVQSNNATLFEHRNEADADPVSAAQAARMLVTYQAFAIGGGVSKPFNLSHAPLVKQGGYAATVTGDNLFETLWLNAVCVNDRQPMPSTAEDRPAWERNGFGEPERGGRLPTGYLDYLTWQSRRIRMLSEPGHDLRFSRACVLQGHALSDGFGPHEPMFAYFKTKQRGFVAHQLQPGRALWRDSHALLQHGTDQAMPPAVVRHVASAAQRRHVPRDRLFVLTLYGLSSDRAKLELWRHEELPLPSALLLDDDLVAAVGDMLSVAEGAAGALRQAVRRLAELQLAPQTARRPDKDEAARLSASYRVAERCWPRLEEPFRRAVVALQDDVDGVRCEWLKAVVRTARQSLEEILASLDASPRTMLAAYDDGVSSGQWGAVKVLNVELHKITHPMEETRS